MIYGLSFGFRVLHQEYQWDSFIYPRNTSGAAVFCAVEVNWVVLSIHPAAFRTFDYKTGHSPSRWSITCIWPAFSTSLGNILFSACRTTRQANASESSMICICCMLHPISRHYCVLLIGFFPLDIQHPVLRKMTMLDSTNLDPGVYLCRICTFARIIYLAVEYSWSTFPITTVWCSVWSPR